MNCGCRRKTDYSTTAVVALPVTQSEQGGNVYEFHTPTSSVTYFDIARIIVPTHHIKPHMTM